ncbi:MAG TPA: GNAT family N-acetyltransferase [Tepidisphaeraceae bacterium]|jgi:GNAT superfamily N-acetyltransferase|nr:GNAT family N-acetyltransferase [Tepidisphaeraceae bacterium]
MSLPDFLPGKFSLLRGLPRDYAKFEAFHYRPKRPATWADVWLVRYIPFPIDGSPSFDTSRDVAIGVLSYPTAVSRGRQKYFLQQGWPYKRQIHFANRNLRAISRIVVHPQFRGLGLSTHLVRKLIESCPTRYVEASAMMGRAHPFFARAGMRSVAPDHPDHPVYYIFDKQGASHAARSSHQIDPNDRAPAAVINSPTQIETLQALRAAGESGSHAS